VTNVDKSASYLNIIQSAIASVFKVIHPDKPPISSNPLLQKFFASARRLKPHVKSTNTEIYDIQPLLDRIRSRGPTSTMTLERL
ncbi:hypothetical protein BGW37DRAFT_405001, partial [Umbelopsis sp. PMI_123]